MDSETNKQRIRDFMERAFNQGDLSIVESALAMDSVDHQEAAGTRFADHLKQVISGLRAAFPDLHFEIHNMVAEGDIVAFRSTMTGTHQGRAERGPLAGLTPSGQKVSVPHMHFVRMVDGRTTDLWHVWDTAGMMQQLGVRLPQ